MMSPAVDEILFTPSSLWEFSVYRFGHPALLVNVGHLSMFCNATGQLLFICEPCLRTSHDTAGFRSVILFASVVYCLGKSTLFLISSSRFCPLMLHRGEFKTLKPFYTAFLHMISVSCHRFCNCLNYRYISTSQKVSQKCGCQ